MYRDTKKSVAGYVQIPRRVPMLSAAPRHELKRSSTPCPSCLLLHQSSPIRFSRTRPFNYCSLRSVVSPSVTSVSDKLESTDHLTNCEETQNLSNDNTPSNQLLLVDVAKTLHNAVWCRRSRCWRLADEGVGVSYALDESLEVGLESRDGSAASVSYLMARKDHIGRLTEVPSSVLGRRAFLAPVQLAHSRSLVEFVLKSHNQPLGPEKSILSLIV
jgi:hypothetical protein